MKIPTKEYEYLVERLANIIIKDKKTIARKLVQDKEGDFGYFYRNDDIMLKVSFSKKNIMKEEDYEGK